jgi:hypothetical protein
MQSFTVSKGKIGTSYNFWALVHFQKRFHAFIALSHFKALFHSGFYVSKRFIIALLFFFQSTLS